MVLTAEQAFKNSQKGAIREEKKRKAKEFRLAIKKIRKAARQGETEIHLYLISYPTEGKLNKLGYRLITSTLCVPIEPLAPNKQIFLI